MTTFARIIRGHDGINYANDCQFATTATELAARFHHDWLARNPFTIVPDGTLHGARDNGDGTFTNPTPLVAAQVSLVISKTTFMDICEAAFGGNGTGRTRFGAIISACETSTDGEVRFVYERYAGAVTFERSKVAAFMALLIVKGTALITPAVTIEERAAILAGWPNG